MEETKQAQKTKQVQNPDLAQLPLRAQKTNWAQRTHWARWMWRAWRALFGSLRPISSLCADALTDATTLIAKRTLHFLIARATLLSAFGLEVFLTEIEITTP